MPSSTRVERFIAAPPLEVYAALIDPVAVQRWMVPDDMTSEVHHFDARVDGSFRITLTYDAPTDAGKTDSQNDTFHGRFVELVPGERVVQVVEFESADPTMQGESTITYELRDVAGGTEVIGLHDGLPPGLSPDANEIGWTMSLAKLAALIEAD